MSSSTPELIYFDGPGRAELSRLSFHAGNVNFKDTRLSHAEFGAMKTDATRPGPGQLFGSVPCIHHGDLLIAQSQACSLYAAELGLTPDLSAAQRAKDVMLLGVHADVQASMYKCLFGDDATKAAGQAALPAAVEKFLAPVERMLGAGGSFIHGGETPSVGDLALFDLCTSKFPGLVALGVDVATKFPNVNALNDKIRAFPPLKNYLEKRGF